MTRGGSLATTLCGRSCDQMGYLPAIPMMPLCFTFPSSPHQSFLQPLLGVSRILPEASLSERRSSRNCMAVLGNSFFLCSVAPGRCCSETGVRDSLPGHGYGASQLFPSSRPGTRFLPWKSLRETLGVGATPLLNRSGYLHCPLTSLGWG